MESFGKCVFAVILITMTLVAGLAAGFMPLNFYSLGKAVGILEEEPAPQFVAPDEGMSTAAYESLVRAQSNEWQTRQGTSYLVASTVLCTVIMAVLFIIQLIWTVNTIHAMQRKRY